MTATGSSPSFFAQPQQLLTPAAIAAPTNGTGVDITDYEGLILCVQNTGAVTAANLQAKMQTSPDNSVWTDAVNGAFPTITTANTTNSVVVDANVGKFIRWICTSSGTSIVVGVTLSGIKKIR